MKKILFFMFALFATVLVTSCSSEDRIAAETSVKPIEDEAMKAASFLKVKNDIVKYGEDRMAQKTELVGAGGASTETRGIFSKIWKSIKNVFKADGRGFIEETTNKKSTAVLETRSFWSNLFLSRVGNAVVQSVKQVVVEITGGGEEATNGTPQAQKVSAVYTVSPVNPSEIALDSTIIFCRENDADMQQAGGVEQMDSAGYYHNAVILDLFNELPSISVIEDMSDEELLQAVNESVERIFNLEEGILQNDSVHNAIILSNMNLGTYDEDEDEEIISVIETYLESMYEAEGLECDWTEYSKGVMSIIDDSELDEDTKERLRAAFTVTFASAKLWNIEMFK